MAAHFYGLSHGNEFVLRFALVDDSANSVTNSFM